MSGHEHIEKNDIAPSNTSSNDNYEFNDTELVSPRDFSEMPLNVEDTHSSNFIEDNIPVAPVNSEVSNCASDDVNALQDLHKKIDFLNEMNTKKLEDEFLVLKNLFETKILIDHEKDNIIARLSRELQDLRSDLRGKLLLPVIMQIIHEIDLIKKQLPYFENDESPERAEKVLKYLAAIPDDLLEILRSQNVDEFIDNDSEMFNPGKQKAISLIPNEDQEKNKYIAARILPGYVYEEKIIRPEQVRVYTIK